jgi:hypothetical protein
MGPLATVVLLNIPAAEMHVRSQHSRCTGVVKEWPLFRHRAWDALQGWGSTRLPRYVCIQQLSQSALGGCAGRISLAYVEVVLTPPLCRMAGVLLC